MNDTPLRSHLGALALATTLILAACGGGDDDGGAGNDNVPPSASIASSVTGDAAAGPVTFTFNFNEDVGSSFSASSVAVSNGTKGAFNKISATQYTLVVTPAPNNVGNIGLTIAANTVTDLAGNTMPVAAALTQGFDTRPPTVTVTDDTATGIAKGTVIFTFGFSKDVSTSFTADDVVVTGGGTKGTFARVGNAQFTLEVMPTASGRGTLNVAIAAGAFSDAGGTNNLAAASVLLPFDTRAAAPSNAPVATIGASSVVIYSDAAAVPGFNARPDWGQTAAYSEVTLAGNKSLKYTFQGGGFGAPGAFQGMDWSANPVNVESKTRLHMDVWSNDLSGLKISIISAGRESTVTHGLTKGIWNGVDIDLGDFTAPDKAAIVQIKIESATAGDVYIDNIHFYGSAGVICGTAAPICAPTTTIPAGSVVIYSEAATVAGFNPRPDWGQTVTFSEANIANNKSLKYTFQGGGFGAPGAYEGLDWSANPVNVLAKGTLHMDVWSNDLTSLKISISGAGKETAVTQAITKRRWNGVDIDLTSFTAPDKTAIVQIKIESATGGEVYIDNIYFWGTPSGGGSGANPGADAGSAGPVAITLATAPDQFGFIVAGDAVFAGDYIGTVDSSGNRQSFASATTKGAAENGNIGFFNDSTLSTSGQKLDEGGWVSGAILQESVPNFFRYFVLTAPASTFGSSFIGLYVNAPNNGTVNVSSYSSIKLKLWGPVEMYEKANLDPVVELTFTGPKVAGCAATGSGGTEISKTFTANQKLGNRSSYKIGLTGWTVKGVCGTDTSATAVDSVLAKLARVVVNVPSSSFNFVNANPGPTPSYTSGINLGQIAFTNQ